MRVILTLLALSLALPGCGPKAGSGGARKPRIYPCRKVKGTIKLDGKIDELAWKLAYYETRFAVPRSGAKPRAGMAVRLLWDDEFLYIAAVLEDDDVYAMLKEHDSETWLDDVCELFLKPHEKRSFYYEVHVTPLGTTTDLRIGARGAGAMHRWAMWESGVKAGVLIEGSLNDWSDTDKGWMFEAAIPLKAFAPLSPKPQLGDRWRFAVCRYNYSVHLPGGQELTSSAALAKPDFHRHEEYDILEFTD
jgi:hypothetical protein